jgi:hypothetical protein
VAVIVAHGQGSTAATRVDLDWLVGFRARWYGCLDGWADTLFEVGDALLSVGRSVPSLPYLSLEPVCRRGHGSVYKALCRGGVDAEAARDLLVAYLPSAWWPVFAVDHTPWPRPEAVCSPRRGMCRVADPGGVRSGRVVPGWRYQWVVAVSPQADSWTAPADVVRIDPDANVNEVACLQMTALAGRLAHQRRGVVPVFCLDAGYCPITATMKVSMDPVAPARVVVRLRRDRVFYFDPPPKPPGVGGRPKVHGARFACADPGTWPPPDLELDTVDNHYGSVRVQAWTGLHPKPGKDRRWGRQHTPRPRSGVSAPIVRGTVVQLSVAHPEPGTPQTMWLWTAGPDPLTPATLGLIWRAYLRRFACEHTNRFLKQHLSWTAPRCAPPTRPTNGAGSSRPPTPNSAWPNPS